MKQGHLILAASIAASLTGASAQPLFALPVSTGEASRIIQTVNNNVLSTVQKTHLKFVEKKAPAVQMNASAKMNHLQLILKPSAARQAALTSLIADQHNPKSSRFHQWLTPQQFGDNYGVTEGDIASITAWLQAQGFTVNTVYPNKTQIDFSGTVGQIGAAFHTQEGIYEVGMAKEKHLANSGDVSIPTALKDVVAGVMGLNDFHPNALRPNLRTAKWDAARKGLVLNPAKAVTSSRGGGGKLGGKSQAVGVINGVNPQDYVRALVPNDMSTMYGIRDIRANGITGKGVTIAVIEDGDMVPADWTDFVSVFNLGKFGGTFTQMQPQPDASDAGNNVNNCLDPDVTNGYTQDDGETLLDAEWSTAIAPSANIVVATCADDTSYADGRQPTTDNFFGGVYIAGVNLINAAQGRPDIISASYGYGEFFTDAASKSGIDAMWAQADAEGISVFVSTGDSGSNPSFNGSLINGYYGNTAVDANSFATSPNVTGVGGTDLSDILDGTTNQYFAATPSAAGGTALSYVPEIPWNESCGNGVAAVSLGYSSAVGLCNDSLRADFDIPGEPSSVAVALYYRTLWERSEAGSGGPSSVDPKPLWQKQVYGAAVDKSRDLPDVALFAGSFDNNTLVAVCSSYANCTPDFVAPTFSVPNPADIFLSGGTSLASPMFAGIQALMDQGLAARGLPLDQGNAAPTLYALAAKEYGTAGTPNTASLTTCNSNNGVTGTENCVFHNVTRGTISSGCYAGTVTVGDVFKPFSTPNCYFYNAFVADYSGDDVLTYKVGLTTTDTNPTSYGPANKAFPAKPGWSFASGLGSVNAKNLLIAWRAFEEASGPGSATK